MRHGFAYIFINFEQATGFGHIGWGFRLCGETFYFGSTDHLWRKQYAIWNPMELMRYMDVAVQENNDAWAETGTFDEMLQVMRTGLHVRYHAYKEIRVEHPNPQLARALADTMEDAGWNIILNNCVHQSYQVITAFGGELPNPYRPINRFPRLWFDSVPEEAKILKEPSGRIIIPTITTKRKHAS